MTPIGKLKALSSLPTIVLLKRIFGVSTLDVVRANTFVAEAKGLSQTNVLTPKILLSNTIVGNDDNIIALSLPIGVIYSCFLVHF